MGKIGTMVEMNCETDFVARTDDFKELVKDVAMHIAAANPVYLSREDVSPGCSGSRKRNIQGTGYRQTAAGRRKDHRRQTGEVLYRLLSSRSDIHKRY